MVCRPLLCLCVLLAFASYASSTGKESVQKDADTDLIFDNLDSKIKQHQSRTSGAAQQHRIVKRKQEVDVAAEEHWLKSTINRLKRSLDHLLGKPKRLPKFQLRSKSARRRRQDNQQEQDNDLVDQDDEDDEGEEEYDDAEDGDDKDNEVDGEEYDGVLTIGKKPPEPKTTESSIFGGGDWFTLKPSWFTLQPPTTESAPTDSRESTTESATPPPTTQSSAERGDKSPGGIFGGSWFTLKPSWFTLQPPATLPPDDESKEAQSDKTTTLKAPEVTVTTQKPGELQVTENLASKDVEFVTKKPSLGGLNVTKLLIPSKISESTTAPTTTSEKPQSSTTVESRPEKSEKIAIENTPPPPTIPTSSPKPDQSNPNEVEILPVVNGTVANVTTITTTTPGGFFGGSWFTPKPFWYTLQPPESTTVGVTFTGEKLEESSPANKIETTTTTPATTTLTTTTTSEASLSNFGNWFTQKPAWYTLQPPFGESSTKGDDEINVDETTTTTTTTTSSTTTTTTTTTPFPGFPGDDDDYNNGSGERGSGDVDQPFETTTTAKPADVKVYYRITLAVREPFTEEFNDRNNYKYRQFADHVKSAIEDIYADTPGINSLSVISIQKRSSDPFTSRVILDLGISTYPENEEALKNTLRDHIARNRRIGNNEALEEDFSFVKFDAPYRTCEEYEIPCRSGACINVTSRCDGTPDCSDNSDEEDCVSKTEPTPLPSTESPTPPPPTRSFITTIGTTTTTTTERSGVDEIEGSGEDRGNCRADDAVPCSDGSRIICSDQKCDGVPDCDDEEDEANCPSDCTSGEFSCDLTRCIQAKQRCDGTPDCQDQTDEVECANCTGDAFHCDSKCILAKKKCDGNYDCADGTDEDNCIPASECIPGQFQCQDRTCINDYQRCDRRADCPNGEDEINCPAGCRKDQFACGDGFCIPLTAKCDRKYDCRDRSDEKKCPCHRNDYRCGNGFCIPYEQKCNGVHNCQDGSDEINCTNTRPCTNTQWRCSDGTCIGNSSRCDSHVDCPDGSDEKNCDFCKLDQFRCENGTCIAMNKRCDGKADCRSGEDEASCALCNNQEFKCNDGQCIPISKKCNGRRDCQDGSDESDCSGRKLICLPGFWKCKDNHLCIRNSKHCDGIYDCRDHSDERYCGTPGQSTACGENEFQCDSGGCVPNDRVCDRRRDCSDGSDEEDCPPKRCLNGEFTCSDGECIPDYLQCNGRAECRDASDEEGCACSPDQFLCLDGQCIDGFRKCDKRIDCRDGSDEISCPTQAPTSTEPPITSPSRCPSGYAPCRNGQCILASQICDGPVDCLDMSDEEQCAGSSTGLNLRTYPNAQAIKENVYKPDREVVFQCRDEGPLRAQVRWTRPNGQSLPPGSRDVRGRLEIPNIKVEHAGEYICEAVGFPSTAKNAQVSVQLNVERWVPPPTRPTTVCAPNEATCSNGNCIPKTAVCDGRQDCTDGSDESRCNANGCEPNEFRCSNKKCVQKTWKCDGDDDCGDGSDESGCATNPPGSICLYSQFTCHSNNQCIPKSYHCDTERDCMDGSDEIGCSKPVISRPPQPMVTLPVGGLYEVNCTAVGVPVPEIVWRRNWGHIPPKCRTTSVDGFGTLSCPDVRPEDQGAYSCESLNTKGRTFAQPDSILVVANSGNICRPGYFNSDATTEAECIKCFCFGQGVNCRSADLFIYHYQPAFDSLKILGVQVEPITGVVEIKDEPIYRNGAVPELSAVGLNGLNANLQTSQPSQPNLVPYFAMPENYHGNQLKSYGGYLRYVINHNNRDYEVPGPDVILSGNGYKLLHQNRDVPESFRDVDRSVRFFEGDWVKRSDNGRESIATREEIMMALANIDNILIKLQYSEGPLNTTVKDIVMDSAAVPNNNLGSASYVEECSCPVGYTGLSCERCDEGYERHSSGPWLGQCYKTTRTCPAGTYGDPERGIECQICPCPLTNPANQFGRTCSLAPDGDVICDCPSGYVGRRCEQCAPGYEGNPNIPGDSCRPKAQELCNSVGSRQPYPVDGRCQCKNNVDGDTCDQCKNNTFHLSNEHQFGCVSCFCMGVSSKCGSSTYYRDQLGSAFVSSTNDFTIVDIDNRENPITDVRLDSGSRQILYSSFPSQNVFYWSLPSRYLGNKLTSYGGYLRYTLKFVPLPGGQSSRNSAADVQLISSNHIDLLYYGKEQSLPTNSANTFVVPLLEQYWQRSDGQVADREHLLMALADLKAIYIKATYTTNTMEAALISVSLDTANIRNTGSSERASAVEHCYCPEGYKGLSCEDCAFGYTRGDGGLYLGFCEPCSCNGHSNECNPETGECLNCRDHTTGRYCEQCLPGYEGAPKNGIACRFRDGGSCRCDPRGSISDDCFNGMCRCKPNVVGNSCDRCRQGTYGLNSSNVEGCQTCFCSGVASECSESSYYIEQIPTQIFDDQQHGFTLTDRNGQQRIDRNFQFNYEINEISYRFQSGDTRLYWSLPQILTGNQIKSYGGKLEFKQRFTEYGRGRPIQDQDIVIVGDKLTIYWTNPETLYPDRENRISVPISVSNGWQRLDQQAGQRPASREDILIALSNVKDILVRAQPTDTTETSSISDVTLDTAIEPFTPKGRATSVEVCRCPVGYEGSSCESCSLGYYRDANDVATGALGSCTRCPCTENANGCSLGADDYVVCHCQPGYSGSRCEFLDSNNNNTTDGPDVTTIIPPVTINVTIVEPNIKIFEIGSTLRLTCSAVSYRTQSPAQIIWTKDGGNLPESAIDDGRGLLIITNLRVSDSGRYICEAQDGYSIVTKDVTITVGTSPTTAPRVVVNPPYVDVKEGQRIEIQCAASGNPAPNYVLQRADNQLMNPEHTFENGIFRIDRVALSDNGRYNCIAENPYGRDEATFEIFVRVAEILEVTIEPSRIRVAEGETFTVRCIQPPSARAVKWSKENGQLPYDARENDGILTVPRARAQDTGVYVCAITSASGAYGRGFVNVEVTEAAGEMPRVVVSPERLTISQGGSGEVRCDASGYPPPTVKWTKVGSAMSSNVEQVGALLYLRNADERDSGTYMCVAVNTKGLTQSRAEIYVNRGEVPILRIYPNASQNVIAGHTLDLECLVERGSPARITWSRRDGLPIDRNVEQFSRGNIRFNQIRKEQEGEYICEAENEAGSASAVASVNVQMPPELRIVPDQDLITRRIGESLTLECHATGSPAPAVFWTKYGWSTPREQSYPLSRNDNSRQGYAVQYFRSLSKADEGLYICQARSDAGTQQRRIQLIVDSLPERGDITGEDATSGNGFRDLDTQPDPTKVNKYIAPVGRQAELRCTVNALNNPYEQMDSKWIRSDNAPLPEDAYVRGGTLYIDNVQESARGPYSCVVTRRANGQRIFVLNAYLDVISPPNITLNPKRQVVHPGDNAYIQCSASGQQPITISWVPMGREFPNSVSIRDGLLQFQNIKLSDAGRYRCTAVNSAGEADAVADVFVQETQYRPSISAVNRSPIAPAGSSVTLQCHLKNSTSNDIRWYRENGELPRNSYITQDRNLRLDNVQFADEGRYYCEIATPAGPSKDYIDLKISGSPEEKNDLVAEPTLFVSPPEREYRVGENVEINCQSNQPGAITTWSKPSSWLDDNVRTVGGTLRINNLKRENGGVYRCEATGHRGVYHKDYDLQILEDPSNLESAVETKIAPKGSGVVLECKTNLREPINYEWTKAGGDLPNYIDPYSRTIQLNDLAASDAGAYVCTARDYARKVQVPVVLVITGIVPYFTQAPTSFVALPTLTDPYIQFSFEISIKPENEDGLILYNGNKQGVKGGDFISLSLVSGVPEFRYNLGYSVTIVRAKPILMGQWHTIKVVRNRKKVSMYVDGEGPFVGNADGKIIGLDLSENLYLGGVPRFDYISPEVGVETGFVGCISSFKVGHAALDVLRDAIEKEGVTNCETCSENRCQNKGVCQESLTNEGYVCICHSGYSGPTCSKLKGEACSPYSCGSGKCLDNDESYECMCPMGKTGSRCEKDVEISEPAFAKNSFIAYNVPKQRRLRYALKFKANTSDDGILLYCGETEEGYGDFASLALKDGHVEFRFDIGNGPTIIRSQTVIRPGEQVVVTASRSLSEGRLIVNGDIPTVERTPGNNKTPNLLTFLYVGGTDKRKIKINEGVGVTAGFSGCISDINVGGTEINMIRSAVDSSNVQECNDINNNIDPLSTAASSNVPVPYDHKQTGCSSSPCRNDGTCFPTSPVTYQCTCINGYSGINCEIAPNQCDHLKPCQNDGVCHGNTTYYSCDCTLGYTGTNCEQRAELKTDVHFDGNGYLEFNKQMLPHDNENQEEVIALELSTNSSNGLILWHGQSPNEDAQGQDYLALSVVNGHLEFSYDLGSGPAIIHNSQVKVNDGERHLVILKRSGRSGSIEVDRQFTKKDESVGIANSLNCRGNIYLGGTPDIPFMTTNKYKQGFVGCIHNFELPATNQIDLGRKAVSGRNAKPCSSYEGIYSYEDNEVIQ